MRRHRFLFADEFPLAPSAEPDLSRDARDRRPGRRDPRPRSGRFLGCDAPVPRPDRHQLDADDKTRRQDHQHQLGRSLHQIQLPGFPALSAGRSRYSRRRRNHAAASDRGGEARDRLPTTNPKFAARGAKLTEAHRASLKQVHLEATYGWEGSPISTARLSAELFEQIRGEDWSLACTKPSGVSDWPQQLWDMSKYYHYTGDSGGNGIGFGAAAAAGVALANKKHGRFTVTIQPDGDLDDGPRHPVDRGASPDPHPLCDAQQPRLSSGGDGTAEDGEPAHAGRRARPYRHDVDANPLIDYATIAKGMGVYAEGPIENPKDLAPALETRHCCGEARRTGPSRRRHQRALIQRGTHVRAHQSHRHHQRSLRHERALLRGAVRHEDRHKSASAPRARSRSATAMSA